MKPILVARENDYARMVLDCDCMSPSHMVLFEMIKWDDMDTDLIISVQLYQYRKWYQRLWLGIKYVFNLVDKNGHWDCTLVNKTTAKALISLLEEYVNEADA